ncbi:MAG TPA: LD-carboxypeptidase [Lachnoclostridium phytofermentans]|uniref:LD-carboxypeptidase n=1 Tax=Lachnoclostridium phytofermentans TaxID=66219 RepID=A0A3D2X1G7_9FIRM|nr:LD-carboxypeptidase [Lachnoclostridium sp.]HCL00962.1 LD-carboxypeptidase [Lachnoclostridium phytofermentans]
MEKNCLNTSREHLIFPNPLKKGDTIGLVCPSSPTTKEKVVKSVEFMQDLGFDVKLGRSCWCELHGYLAGDASLRAEDINRMFADDTVKAIFCIRGGYGSSQIMNLLNYDMIRKHPKIFVGYSDITNLLSAFFQLCGFVTFHGPMVASNFLQHFDPYTEESLWRTLFMGESLTFQNPKGRELTTVKEGCAEGLLVGGNLSLITSQIGTFYAPDFRGKILFLEDVGETVPRIGRMLDQLWLTGIIGQIRGILLGDFTDCTNPYDSEYGVNELFQDFFCQFKKPVLSNLACGHSFPTATLPIGTFCTMDTIQKQICFYR